MKTLQQVIALSGSYLAKNGIDRPNREAEELIADQLACRRIDLFLQFERPLIEAELEAIRIALKKRVDRLPLAYISGKVEFGGLHLEVTDAVLIPRVETEILVEMIIKQNPQGKLLDLCTGSGAIGLALKKRCPHLDVTLVDICEKALAVCKKNADAHQLSVNIVQSDLLDNVKEKFDIIVCNPPYISKKDYNTLAPEVKKEPYKALVGGESGYEFYERLSKILDCQQIWFELGTQMGPTVAQLFENKGYQACITKDFAGHDRYLSLRR